MIESESSRNRRVAVFLGGDSYPRDQYIEQELRVRLTASGSRFITHDRDKLESITAPFSARLLAVERVMHEVKADQIMLIGRSSGARLLTHLAASGRVPAETICLIALGYPFREAGREAEPDRYQHLSQLATPTLILQGKRDHYGGAEIREIYQFSSAIQLTFIDADHEMHMTAEAWDDIAAMIEDHFSMSRAMRSETSRNHKRPPMQWLLQRLGRR